MKNRLSKLIDVKSIVTIILTGAFTYLSIIGQISPDQYITIFTVVIGFYFGTQYQKSAQEVGDNSNEK